ncbi:MAG TPA: response regulator transcription factor [Candidatus Baltobacteraceae bacterium]|nr:response regulator transcription factor [Candidatus Baltobacteraceae bacterium]
MARFRVVAGGRLGVTPAWDLSTARVLVISGETLFARALARIVASDPGIEVVEIAAASDQVVSIDDVDVAIVDVDAETPDQLLLRLKTAATKIKICALSVHEQGELMEHCLASGMDAYVVKSSAAQQLPDAIRAICRGQGYADPRAAATLLCNGTFSRRRPLSAREKEITQLIVEGLTNREIGQRLAISEKTIKNHVSNIRAKLDCKVRSQIAVAAVRMGLA